MKNREIIKKRLDKVESILINLKRIVNTQEPIQVYKSNIDEAIATIEDIQSFVEREPKSNYEQNSASR
jgi:5-bromo-4-chloroindolyl phosphate hydrolysis protein